MYLCNFLNFPSLPFFILSLISDSSQTGDVNKDECIGVNQLSRQMNSEKIVFMLFYHLGMW